MTCILHTSECMRCNCCRCIIEVWHLVGSDNLGGAWVAGNAAFTSVNVSGRTLGDRCLNYVDTGFEFGVDGSIRVARVGGIVRATNQGGDINENAGLRI